MVEGVAVGVNVEEVLQEMMGNEKREVVGIRRRASSSWRNMKLKEGEEENEE